MTISGLVFECTVCKKRSIDACSHFCPNGCGFTLVIIDDQRVENVMVRFDRRQPVVQFVRRAWDENAKS